jgi:threonine dehydratase
MRLKIKKSDSYKFSKKYLDLIPKSRVYDVADKTPVTFATNLSTKLKNDVFLKREDMQPIFSLRSEVHTIKLLI